MAGRIALIGGDNPHAKGWLETATICPDISEVVLCGDWGNHGDRYDTVSDIKGLEEGPSVEMALVCARNVDAPKWAKQLLQAGIPTLVEKPVARTSAEVAELNAISASTGVFWSTCFLNRLHPAVVKMRDLLDEGTIGRLVSVEGRMVTSSVARRDPGHWLFQKEVAGGGILHWLAIHTVDLVRFIAGCNYNTVSAQTATLVQSIDVEEIASATFGLQGGAIGHIHAAYALPRRYGDISMVFRGEKGDITWQSWDYAGRQDRLIIQSAVEPWANREYVELACPAPGGGGYGGEMGTRFLQLFLASSRGEQPFVCDGNDALCALQFVEGAYKSAQTGKRVELSS